MKRLLNFLVPALFVVAVLASVVDVTGIAENIPVLSDAIGFLSFGGFIGSMAVSPAVADPGPGYTEQAPITAGTGHGAAGSGKEYLGDDIDKKIVKVRPNDNPLDTLTREINNTKKCDTWEAGSWEIGVRATKDQLDEAYTGASATYGDFKVKNRKMWKQGDVFVLVDSAGAYITDGGTPALPLAFTVRGDGTSANYISVHRISSNGAGTIPSISITNDVFLMRMGTAVSETTAKVPAINQQPSPRSYYNQIHMAMIEESVIHNLYQKKVNMDFGTYQEQTIWDFRREMELTHLFGIGGLSYDADGNLVHLATGVWNQCTQQSTYTPNTFFTDAKWNAICKDIFDGNNGSTRRFLFAGSNLINLMCGAGAYQKQLEAKNTEVVMGVQVNKIETPFGELLVKPMGSLFEGGRSNFGLVLDMNYVTKYQMEPLQTKEMDFDATGQKRVKAVRLLETCSLFLENLPVHRRIIPG